MRVRLAYTVDEEDVLREAAKIVNLAADDLQQAIELFKNIQMELVGIDDEAPNVAKGLEMLDELRKALLAVDTRAMEVGEIVASYDEYQRGLRAASDAPTLVSSQSDEAARGEE